MEVQGILIKKSTQEIIKHCPYPALDINRVLDLDDDLEWLITVIPYAQPVYDSTYFSLITHKDITNISHPDFPHLNQYRITYTVERKSNSDVIRDVENIKLRINKNICLNDIKLETIILGLNIVFNNIKNIVVDANEQVTIDKITSISNMLIKNNRNVKIKKTKLIAGEEPNINEDWEIE